MVKIYNISKLINDDNMLKLEGNLIDEVYIRTFINTNSDIYKENGDLLLSFRKKILSKKACNLGYNCFNKASNRISYARGTAAGPIDRTKLPKSVGELRPMDKTEKGVKNTKNWTYYYKRNS